MIIIIVTIAITSQRNFIIDTFADPWSDRIWVNSLAPEIRGCICKLAIFKLLSRAFSVKLPLCVATQRHCG